jgi:Methyltransferase domain
MPDIRELVSNRLNNVDDPASISSALRARRWQRLLGTFPDLVELRVLDIGGEARFWRDRDVHPAHVTMVNVFRQEVEEDWITAVAGDGCDLPEGLGEFDLVFSNSVLEHVGGHWRRERFAEQVRGAAPRYWVQTPNRYFPIEPHFVFPFFQHLPVAAQVQVARAWPLGLAGWDKDREKLLREALEIELVSATEMARYFPDAELLREKVAGLTKSFIAVKRR